MRSFIPAVVLSATLVLAPVSGVLANTQKFDGNDTGGGSISSDFLDWIGSTLGLETSNVEQVAKVDGSSGTNEGLTVTTSNNTSGSWSFSSTIDFVVVKAGNAFTAYYYENGLDAGSWDTLDAGLTNHKGKARDLSHLSLHPWLCRASDRGTEWWSIGGSPAGGRAAVGPRASGPWPSAPGVAQGLTPGPRLTVTRRAHWFAPGGISFVVRTVARSRFISTVSVASIDMNPDR